MRLLFSYGFLAPPTIFIVLCLLGPVIALVWRRLGLAIALISGFCLFAAATPALSFYLMRQLEAQIPAQVDLTHVQAIVVLGGDVRVADNEGQGDALGPLSLQRVMDAVTAYRQLHKPIMVSGGVIYGAHRNLARLMKDMLENEFGVPVTWTEDRSMTTWENAAFVARMLLPAGIKDVAVVTSSPDLPRALWSFQQTGLKAVPWHVRRAAPSWSEIKDFLPNLDALQSTFYAVHEMIGGVYYRFCYAGRRRDGVDVRDISSPIGDSVRETARGLLGCGRS